jgi:ferrous-iron efflux pump FieF
MPHDSHLGGHGQPGAMAAEDAARITRRTAFLSVGVATILIGTKLWAWLVSGSVALLASLADSSLDLAASLFTLWAVTYAAQPADAEHRHGHGKAEGFAALLQAGLVGASAMFIALEAFDRLMTPTPLEHSGLAIAVMCLSIALTGGLVWAQTRAVRKTGSVATAGDRAHYAADIGANLVVLVGIVASAALGALWADPIVGFLVAIWLCWGAYSVVRGGVDLLMDRELSDDARARITALAKADGAIGSVHQLRTRASGPFIHIQFHADLDPTLTLREAHAIMVAAEDRIREAFPAADIIIHPDPVGFAEPHGLDAFRTEDEPG